MLHYSKPPITGMAIHSSEPTSSGDVINTTTNEIDGIQKTVKWEYEEITIDRGPSGLGFTVAGGVDDPHHANDFSIYITRFIPDGPAALDGRLKLEDIIVRVDENDLTDVKHSEAVAALKNSGNRVQLLIKRRSPVLVNNYNRNILTSNFSKHQKPQQKNNNNSNKSNQPRFFTSAFSSPSNHLPPLPKSSQSSSILQRGSTQYATTRDAKTSSKSTSKLKAGSSSLSLQPPDEVDGSVGRLSNENNSNAGFSKSTSAIDFDAAKNLTRLPRTVVLQRSNRALGFNIVGGVAGGGTFITYIVPGGVAERSNKLHCGDQILSVNGIDLRFATHEEAATSLKQAGHTVKLVVKYRPEEYIKFENEVNNLREKNMFSKGTLQTSQKRSLHARALFDYDPTKDSGLPSKGLSFRFGDILHIINASDDEWWQARRVLENGKDDVNLGIIPSKKKVEKRERARLKSVKFINRNNSETTLDRRRKKFSFSKKFPFMKSRENIGLDGDDYDLAGSQSNSRGILSSSSVTSINNSERGSIRYDGDEIILSYEPVLQQDIDYARPVALYGPIKEEIEAIRDDLSCDNHFFRMESIVPYTTRPPKEGEIDGVKYHFVSMQEMKRDLAKHKFVEAGELNNNLYGTSIDSIREVAESGKHCLLNISPKAIKRLHDANLYPVTIFIKPKSVEFLLEMNKRWSQEEAIAAMDQANRMEQEFGAYFTATVQMDNPNEVLSEIMNVISQHSGPRIWIPTTFEALNSS